MLDICKLLFNEWNDAGVRYCHWKSNEHLEEGLDGSTDLDIYVCQDDKNQAETILKKCKYVKFLPQRENRYPMVDEWIGFDYSTGKLVHVHQHYQIITGTKYNKEYVFPVNELIVDSRILDEKTNVYIASPNLEIIILYSRIVLKASDKRKISANADYQREIDFLKKKISIEELNSFANALFNNNAGKVVDLIIKDSLSFDEWQTLYSIVEESLKPFKKYSHALTRVRYNYYKYRKIKNAVLNKKMGMHIPTLKTLYGKGLSICFLGADGSGKSTISIDIQKWLNWKIAAERFYLGSGDHYNSLTKRILQKSNSIHSEKKHAERHDERRADSGNVKKKQGVIKRIIRRIYVCVQSSHLKTIATRSTKELIKAQKYMSHGAIAIYDRFPQIEYEGIYDGPKVRQRCLSAYPNDIFVKLSAKLEERALLKAQKYQPDLMFKLLLPPEESVRRKPDHTIEEVAAKAQLTEKLKFEKSKIVLIDATQEYEQELLEIKRYIWKAITNDDN